MCLAVPARIISVNGILGVIDLEGVRREVSLILCPEAAVGQYALVHAGFAISVIDEEEAQLSLETFDEFRRIIEEGAA